MHFKTFSSWIEVNGTRLDEYQVQSPAEPSNTSTCWVPSQLGKPFSVKYRNFPATTPMKVDVWVDGQQVPYTHNIRGPGYRDTTECSHIRVSDKAICPLEFSQLELTEKGPSEGVSQNLGTIAVSFYPGILIKCRPKDFKVSDRQSLSTDPVPEGSKKAGAHRVALGVKKEKGLKFAKHSVKIPPNATPSASFIFHYRPLDLLVAQDIAPRSTLRGGNEAAVKREILKAECDSDIEVIESDNDNTKRMPARLRRAKRSRPNEPSQGASSSRPSKQPKTDSEPLSHKGIFVDCETIDLTAED